MTDSSMNFGPAWIRNLRSEGTSTTGGGTSGGTRYQLAEYRYGREEMLALFDKLVKPPSSLLTFKTLYSEQTLVPLALLPTTEEEQRGWQNRPTAISGAPRGRGGSLERGGRISRGRGGYQAYGRAASAYDSGWGNGEQPDWSPRKEFASRSALIDNWRRVRNSSEEDDGWRNINSGRPLGEKWGRSASWRGDGDSEERNGPPERGARPNWHENNRGGPLRRSWDNEDHLPEWATENPTEGGGTFDERGAFHGSDDEQENRGMKRDMLQKSTSQQHIPNRSIPPSLSSSKSTTSLIKSDDSDKYKEEPIDKDGREDAKPNSGSSPESDRSKPQKPDRSEESDEKKPEELRMRPSDKPLTSNGPPEPVAPIIDKVDEDFDRLQEDLVLKLVVDEETPKGGQTNFDVTGVQPPPNLVPPSQEKWYYQDPQGTRQGPFPNVEMAEWYKAGYFCNQLNVMRECDERYFLLGELINLCGGDNPFLSNKRFPVLKNETPKLPDDMLPYQFLSQLAFKQQVSMRNLAEPWSALTLQQQELAAQRLLLQQQQQLPHDLQFMQQSTPSNPLMYMINQMQQDSPMILTEGTMNSEEIKAEYTSSLADLTFNSKPLINVLTMLAEENVAHAPFIVEAIEEHLAKVQTNVKLPILYLVDCIAKNIGQTYTQLFSQNIVKTFCSVFKVVDEETRAEMFKLRQTWNNIFPQQKLFAIDVQIRMLDPAWPVTAQPTTNSIHFNPRFLQPKAKAELPSVVPEAAANNLDMETFTMQQKLIQKQKELIELQQKKLKLELLQTQVKLQKQLESNPRAVVPPQNILLKPEVAKQLMPEVAKQLVPAVVGGVTKSAKPALSVGSRAVQSAPKITPVNSALATATRPAATRDPRLLRQQAKKASNGTNNSNSVSLGSKTAILDSNNKVVTNTKSVPKPSRSKNVNSDKSVKTISLLESPVKKSDKSERSPTKSPSRHKKKEHVTDKKSFKESKREKHKIEPSLPTFKGVKTKNRNYIRRNRSPSYSPELNQDIDLRHTGPPEKQARLQTDEDKSKIAPGMDVDLRQLDIPKKRPSSEIAENNSKKSKNQVFDALFGNEDTDLRTVLPVAQPERPPTPPPPIISVAEKEKDKEPMKKSSDFDVVRAKLANATGRDKIMAKSFRKKRPQEDEDLRVHNDSLNKIIISSDDEKGIKAGTLTKEQEQNLVSKIIAQIEHQKLKQAQLKDKEESVGNNLQPVSDEELELNEEPDAKFGDKDDRVNFVKFPRDPRDSRRGGSYWRGTKRRHWDNPHMGPHPRPALRPWMHPPANAWRPIGPNFNRPTHNNDYQEGDSGKKSPEVSLTDLAVESVSQDDIKTINIDGVPRDIRYYDETAIVFMNWDDPREISFQNGNRRVVFDDKDVYFLSFNDPYKDVTIAGSAHKVRLGGPSREIFIDGKPYECYFGGPSITIDLEGQMTGVKLDGPPPQVKIGNVKRADLVAGKVNLIIDAKILVPVFLDAKVQKFVIDGETHTLKFVDALKTVLINDVPFKVEFGGLPKPITVHDKKHFIRFSVLPKGVKPGAIKIKDMEGGQTETDDSQDGSYLDSSEPALPVFSRKKKFEDEPERNSNSPHFFQSFMQQSNLDMLSSVMTSSIAPSSGGGYQIEDAQSMDAVQFVNPVPVLPSSLNINELFQKLVATGIVATKEPPEQPKPVKRASLEHMKPVSFGRPETLKVRQSPLYDALYSGMQCSSCGMRFPPEQSMHYSQHLDWHFRQNRKGKKNIRVAASRKWYYSLSDWKNYEEIEDLEEREKNFFDQQQSQAEGAGEDGDEEVEIPSVPADPDVQDAHCEVCQDKFDHFFNEDKEEWHLKNAIRVDDKTYHPVCYEDYLASLEQSVEDAKEETKEEEDAKTEEPNIPGLEIILDDDDDEEEPQAEEEVVIEESDESKPSQKEEEEETKEENEDDDDVIIHEVVPEKIEVDDDKEYSDEIPSDFPIKVEQIDDGFMDVEEGLIKIKSGGIKIKSEPLDPDELPIVTPPPESLPPPSTETTQPSFISSIDGNTEPVSSIPTTTANIGSKIKINISKPLPVIAPKEPKDVSCDSVPSLEPIIDPSQPLPPGEEPIQLNIKPALRGLELKKMPPVQKGSELTGMCSIM